MHFSLCKEVYFSIHKIVLKSYEGIQCRTFRKLGLGHCVGLYLPGRRGYVDAQSEDKSFCPVFGSFFH